MILAQKYFIALKEALSEAAERLIFRELEKVDLVSGKDHLHPGYYRVHVDVIYPLGGRLSLFFDQDAGKQMVTEMVGEWIDDKEKIKDGLSEFANAACGRFLARYVEPHHHFKMGLPRCEQMNTAGGKETNGKLWAFKFDDLHIYAAFEEDLSR